MSDNKNDVQVIPATVSEKKKPAVQRVRNRSGHRVELVIDNQVVVFLPGKTVEIPADFPIPGGLGLYVK